ncbi:MAG: HAD family hydrolase, partial [Nitrospirae bacterium]
PLTGESLPVGKTVDPVAADSPLAERRDMVWMGTSVTNGVGRALVVATGMDTELGRIARLTQSLEREPTPLQRQLARLGRQLGALSVAIAAVVGLVGWLSGKPLLEMFLTGVSLAVAVVPEGLPAVVTITLALGVRHMVRRRALLRRLQAAEALGAATVICTDKTGTLTQNEMTVRRIWLPGGEIAVTGTGYDPSGRFQADGRDIDPRARPDLLALLTTGLVCNHARLERTADGWRAVGEPTEAALVTAARKAGLERPAVRVVSELSFSSARKRMTVVTEEDGRRVAQVKGAPEVILDRCTHLLELREGRPVVRPLGEADRQGIQAAYERLAEAGLRTLALARRTLPEGLPPDRLRQAGAVERELTFLGLVGIIDPPRPEVPEAVRTARRAGIRVIMI